MYGNPYNNQMYMQDLQGLRDRIDRQMQIANQNQPQATPITQNFQLAPNQNNGIKYVNSIEDVKKELVLADTLFVNKEYTLLWHKNASGEVKTYELKEIIELDEKDRKIADLMARINALESEMKDNEPEYDNANVVTTSASKKSKNGKSDKPSNE
jgi:hypothetical protein